MNVELPWRIRAGSSLALVILLTITGSFVLSRVDLFRSHLLQFVIGIALAGLGLLLATRLTRTRAGTRLSLDKELTVSKRPEHPLAFFRKLGYWGGLLVASALPIFFFTEYLCNRRHSARAPVVARTNIPPMVVELPKPTVGPAVKFPPLKMEGFICNGTRSTVILNGRTLSVGESVQGVKVVAIEVWGVEVEMEGHRKRIGPGF